MILTPQIERANARAAMFATPIVLVKSLSATAYAFRVTTRLNDDLARSHLAAFSFDQAGSCCMHWDGPKVLDPRLKELLDWMFDRARQVANDYLKGLHVNGAEVFLLGAEMRT